MLRKLPCLIIQESRFQSLSHHPTGTEALSHTPHTHTVRPGFLIRSTPGFPQQSLRCPDPSNSLIWGETQNTKLPALHLFLKTSLPLWVRNAGKGHCQHWARFFLLCPGLRFKWCHWWWGQTSSWGYLQSCTSCLFRLCKEIHRITEHPELEGTYKDHQVQLPTEWSRKGLNPNHGIISTML